MSRDHVLNELMRRRVKRETALGSAGDPWRREELLDAWRAAQAEAASAYLHWCSEASADACAVYRAAEDRADAAQDALWREYTPATAADRVQVQCA
jgi:hypothetical protein